MSTQFDLEQAIMRCWSVTSDIKVVAEALMDHGATPDQVSNMLIGLHDLYEVKFNKCFDLFEQYIKEKRVG